MGGVILPEHYVGQPLILGYQGQGVELVLPDNIVGFLQSGAFAGADQLFKGCHEAVDLFAGIHPGYPVVPAGDKAQELAVGGTILSDRHSGVAGPFLQLQHVRQGGVRPDIGVAGDKAGLVALDPGDHGGLALHALGAVDKGDAALLCQGDCHPIIRNRLHDCRY